MVWPKEWAPERPILSFSTLPRARRWQRRHQPLPLSRGSGGGMVAHIPLLLIPWLSPPGVWFFSPPSLSHTGSPHLSLFLSASVCIPSLSCGHHMPLCSSTPPLCSLKQTGPGSPPSPSRKARVLLASIPSSTPPATSHLLSWALPLLRLGSLAGFSVQHLDGRAGEAYRNRAAASGNWGRGSPPNWPCLVPLASWASPAPVFSLAGIFREYQHHH